MDSQLRRKIIDHRNALTFYAYGHLIFGRLWPFIFNIGITLIPFKRNKEESAFVYKEMKEVVDILKEVTLQDIAKVLGDN